MGEASVYLAQVCFGSGMNGDAGYDNPDVLYLAFPGDRSETVPSKEGKDLNEIMTMGQGLMQKAFEGSRAPVSGGTGTQTMSIGASGAKASSTRHGGGSSSGQGAVTSAGFSDGGAGGTTGAGGTGAVTGAAPTPTDVGAAALWLSSEGGSGGTVGGSTTSESSSNSPLGDTGMYVSLSRF
ncbi:hypothetical protein JCM10295v2_006707 [Rhodotorula toruloides]